VSACVCARVRVCVLACVRACVLARARVCVCARARMCTQGAPVESMLAALGCFQLQQVLHMAQTGSDWLGVTRSDWTDSDGLGSCGLLRYYSAGQARPWAATGEEERGAARGERT
jgi:hypothetical protein